MRISDWSSDVCSSDLPVVAVAELGRPGIIARAAIDQEEGRADPSQLRIHGREHKAMVAIGDPRRAIEGLAADLFLYGCKGEGSALTVRQRQIDARSQDRKSTRLNSSH